MSLAPIVFEDISFEFKVAFPLMTLTAAVSTPMPSQIYSLPMLDPSAEITLLLAERLSTTEPIPMV